MVTKYIRVKLKNKSTSSANDKRFQPNRCKLNKDGKRCRPMSDETSDEKKAGEEKNLIFLRTNSTRLFDVTLWLESVMMRFKLINRLYRPPDDDGEQHH